MIKLIPINEDGHVIGEYHSRCRHRDSMVEMILRLRDAGFGYKRIARATAVPRETVMDICSGKIRGQYAVRWKRVRK